MAGARAYIRRLAELAPQYGFGFVERKLKPQAASGAAAYLSSYFVTGRGRKAALWESVMSSQMPRSIIHVSVSLTSETRCTMRALRLHRALFVVWDAALPFEEVHAVRSILEAFRGRSLCGTEDPQRLPIAGQRDGRSISTNPSLRPARSETRYPTEASPRNAARYVNAWGQQRDRYEWVVRPTADGQVFELWRRHAPD
jgi:hypothetical protein